MTPLLEVRDLEVEFALPSGLVQAVRGVDLRLERGETVGLVGESGCGKSVTALALMRLLPIPPARMAGGSVLLDGEDLLKLPAKAMRRVRGGRIGMVFQDPFSSLNPTMTLGAQVMEAIRAHAAVGPREARDRAQELFRAVRLPSPELRMRQYPHQVSGGQRQRAMIAMAFSTNPSILIADEPTTALDVTVQAQIMALMQDFRQRTHAAILLITHDIGLVAESCDRVLVMYAGKIVEDAPVAEALRSPKHPYTIGLLQSLPDLHAGRKARLQSIPGRPPDLAHLPAGCAFADRCSFAMEVCRQADPERIEVGPHHFARCVLARNETPGR